MIRLLVFDLDGTVLDPFGRPSPAALATIGELAERGIGVASISGRSVSRSLKPLAACPQLTRQMHVCGYNGAVGVGPVQDGHRKLLFEKRLAADVFVDLAQYTRQRNLNLVYCRCDSGEEGLVEEYRFLRDPDELEVVIDWTGDGYVRDGRLIERIVEGEFQAPPKVMIFPGKGCQERTIAELRERFGRRIYVAWGVKDLLEVMHPEADKGVALRALAERVGVPLEQIMAIGDGNNDLPMLQQAGLGILMGNAEPETHRAVEGAGIHLTLPLAEDGFSQAVRKYILDGKG